MSNVGGDFKMGSDGLNLLIVFYIHFRNLEDFLHIFSKLWENFIDSNGICNFINLFCWYSYQDYTVSVLKQRKTYIPETIGVHRSWTWPRAFCRNLVVKEKAKTIHHTNLGQEEKSLFSWSKFIKKDSKKMKLPETSFSGVFLENKFYADQKSLRTTNWKSCWREIKGTNQIIFLEGVLNTP